MVRPHKLRRIAHGPGATYFKPRGIPLRDLEEVHLAQDELEALRLVDFEGLSFELAGDRMGVSRGTIGRLVERGRRTLVDAVLHGQALCVAEGPAQELTDEPLPCCGRGGRRGRRRREGAPVGALPRKKDEP